jgi:choline kinase
VIDLKNYSILLLSAGIGKRLGKIGLNKPKCLLDVKNKKLIEHLIEILQKRNVKEISIVLGYKSQMIINTVKSFKKIKFNFIKIKDYKKNGHAKSWHSFKKIWIKKKLPILLFHTDIFFDPIYLDNIVESPKHNIIGIHSNNKIYKKKSVFVYTDKNQLIKKLNFQNKGLNKVGEVIGINKISKNTAKNLFLFMNKFLVKENKKLNWEFMLDNYIKTNKDSFFVLKKQNFFWTNVNFKKDYLSIKD